MKTLQDMFYEWLQQDATEEEIKETRNLCEYVTSKQKEVFQTKRNLLMKGLDDLLPVTIRDFNLKNDRDEAIEFLIGVLKSMQS